MSVIELSSTRPLRLRRLRLRLRLRLRHLCYRSAELEWRVPPYSHFAASTAATTTDRMGECIHGSASVQRHRANYLSKVIGCKLIIIFRLLVCAFVDKELDDLRSIRTCERTMASHEALLIAGRRAVQHRVLPAVVQGLLMYCPRRSVYSAPFARACCGMQWS